MPETAPTSRLFLATLGVVVGAVGVLAILSENATLGLSAGIVGLYLLHLVSIRLLRDRQEEQWQALRQVERMVDDVRSLSRPGASAGDGGRAVGAVGREGEAESGEEPHLALGTVALIRDYLTPEEVSHVLLEQRREPSRRFGEIAMQAGFLTHEQLEELLADQERGEFPPEQIRAARQRVEAYRRERFRLTERPPA